MTVQKTTNKNVYVGDGVTTVFPITFAFNPKYPEYIHVYARVDNVLSEVKNFNLDTNTGKITYPTSGDPLTEDDTLIIMRTMPLTQEMNLVNQGPFFAEDIEQSLDDLVMMVQQINEGIGRSLTVELDSSENPNEVISQIFDAKNLTQELASEATAAAAASLQSEQNAKASETISSQNKTATDENRSSVESSKAQVDILFAQVAAYEATTQEYKNSAATSAAQASEYEWAARANAASANGSASLASQKAGEADTSEKNAAASVAAVEALARLAEQYKNLAYQYMQGSVNIPVGTPLLWFWGEDNIPVGFIRYTTSSLSATTYPDLFGLVGHKYGGSGDEFYLPPDLYGRFMEISDVGGEYHEAGLPNLKSAGYIGGRGFDASGVIAPFESRGRCRLGNGSGSNDTTGGAVGFNANLYNPIYRDDCNTVQPKSITAILIIKAFAGANPKATDLEITRVANDLLKLRSDVDDTVKIVDKGRSSDGTIWYRKWSDGWLEQGGTTYNTSLSCRITFLKSMANTTYNAYVCSGSGNKIDYANATSVSVGKKEINGCYLLSRGFNGGENQNSFEWYACGQGGND